jgi:hypothetical protein
LRRFGAGAAIAAPDRIQLPHYRHLAWKGLWSLLDIRPCHADIA